MTYLRTISAALAYAATFVVLSLALMTCLAPTMASASSRCHDDQPCWIWSKMGDHKRGVILSDGTRRVVGPCAFARLRDAGRLSARNPRLRGDWFAGC